MVFVLENGRDFNMSKIYAHGYFFRTHPSLSFRNPPWF